MKQLSTLLLFALLTFNNFAQDRTWFWADGIGGNNYNEAKSVITDASGNVYYSGVFKGTTDFDPGASVTNITSNGGYDFFISKLDASGNFIWAKTFGGTLDDHSNAIEVDATGNVFTTGYFQGTVDFDPGAGTSNLTALGADAFILKIDPSGNFIWVQKFASISATSGAIGNSIVLDATGNIYLTGNMFGTVDFDSGTGTYTLTGPTSNTDIFVSKLDLTGNFVWAKKMGSTTSDFGYSIALDATGNVYTTGYYNGTVDFDPGTGVVNLVAPSAFPEIFISKLDNNGDYVWAISMGGTGDDGARSIQIGASGNVYITGYFGGTVDLDPGTGTANLTVAGAIDLFVAKYDSSGNFIWAKGIGGAAGYDMPNAMVLDASENVYSTGMFRGPVDFDPNAGTYNLNGISGSWAVYISKLDASGNFVWAQEIAGNDSDFGEGITQDNMGNLYVVGRYNSTTLTIGATTLIGSTGGYTYAFVTKLDVLNGIIEKSDAFSFTIAPNPFTNYTIINFSEELRNSNLKIIDVLGKEIKTINFTGQQVIIENPEMKKGIYFIQIIDENKNVINRKIVVQ